MNGIPLRGLRFSLVSCSLAVLCVLSVNTPANAAEQNWPQFRGPSGNGICTVDNLPVSWSEEKNVKWKTPIHGRGWSSPVIRDRQVWLTTATEDGHELWAVCVDAISGRVIRDQKLFQVEKPQFCHAFNSYASPTPVVESGRLYVTFGSPGTACLDTQTGKVLWERRDFECNHFRGAGSSPIIYKDLLFLNFDGSDRQYVVALGKQTGKTVWQVNRAIDFQDLGPDGKPEGDGDLRKAFATCHVANFGPGDLLISQGSKAVYAYEPGTGKELWRVEERTSHSGATRPVVGQGMIYVPSGFASGQLLAIRPGAPGEVVEAKDAAATNTQLRVVWRVKKNVPKKPSLTLVGDLLFGIEDNIGIATCWDALTGSVVWSEKLAGHFSASPLVAGTRIYFFSEEGKTIVIEAAREFKKLAENELADGFMASPAVSGNALILRTKKNLYRIEL